MYSAVNEEEKFKTGKTQHKLILKDKYYAKNTK